MKKEVKAGSNVRSAVFGAAPRVLSADELDRVFGGQVGPPAPTPTPTPTPTTPGSGPYPYPYKRIRSYDLYGQEN